MPLSPQSPKCVFARGEKNPTNIDGGDKAQITVVACISAAGYCIPPMVIWDRKKLSLELTAREVPGTCDKGWMDQEHDSPTPSEILGLASDIQENQDSTLGAQSITRNYTCPKRESKRIPIQYTIALG